MSDFDQPGYSLGTEAVSRFTRTPIYFHDQREGTTPDVTGRHYQPSLLRKQRIDLYYDPSRDSYERLKQSQRHEDIHAVTWADPVPDEAFREGGYADAPYLAFEAARRAGAPNTELPAYMGSQDLHVLPGDRARFMAEYKATLSPEKRALLDRMQRAAPIKPYEPPRPEAADAILGALGAPAAQPMLAPAASRRRDIMLRGAR